MIYSNASNTNYEKELNALIRLNKLKNSNKNLLLDRHEIYDKKYNFYTNYYNINISENSKNLYSLNLRESNNNDLSIVNNETKEQIKLINNNKVINPVNSLFLSCMID